MENISGEQHLAGACAQLADALLTAGPDLRVLATSREVLAVSGETPWLVHSLSLPESFEFLKGTGSGCARK
jgi:predicted ATPase